MRFRFAAALVLSSLAFALPALAQSVQSQYSGQVPQTGATAGRIVLTAGTNCSVLKSTRAILYSVTGWATSNQLGFVRVYNTATTPSPTATVPDQMYPMVGGTAGSPLQNMVPPTGLAFPSGIGICVTQAGTATDNTSVIAGGVVNYGLK